MITASGQIILYEVINKKQNRYVNAKKIVNIISKQNKKIGNIPFEISKSAQNHKYSTNSIQKNEPDTSGTKGVNEKEQIKVDTVSKQNKKQIRNRIKPLQISKQTKIISKP